ncbi:MAG: hypothetical protein HN995_14170 [Candidatus Marinimicrobia bacterium]|jgi:hypothetical protein|nr:hypothetical protein [Candidatus Neomarinimicrobiota bacterium]MBT3575517.1 hypothetical protein [Candidatus Neomarinimicrobiota bacterium]MBT3679614.1 hypothetical protein [Candidatus Neomarinimicrobiota bacterium]MBT3950571.1 hypothetical protein [Candidatus Neomarinimicrobiota bacterium]MBT4253442.1 hypothetical protein [Candidatus Neomarinimicrobiota bacterium]
MKHTCTAPKLMGLIMVVVLIFSCASRPSHDVQFYGPDFQVEIERYQNMLDSNLTYLERNSDRFGIDKVDQHQMLDRAAKADLILVWASVLDYMAHLEMIRYTHNGFLFDPKAGINFESLINYYWAFLVQSSRAVHFIHIIDRNGALLTILDEGHPEYGLEANTYTQFKSHFLNVKQAAEFAALQIIYRDQRPDVNPYYSRIAMLEGYNTSLGIDYGVRMSVRHARDVIENQSFSWWYPIQKNFAEWIGHVRVFREGENLISFKDILEIQSELNPGDILFQRREWYMTNAGIPGYWTHAAFYVGDSLERADYFDSDSVRAWVRAEGVASGSFEELLESTFPEAYAGNNLQLDSLGSQTVLEAIGKGVVLQSLSTSLTCDGLGVVRPRLSKADKAKSIYNAFQYFGRGYDFNFDFLTDSSLVCSELIYKSFEPGTDYSGVPFITTEVAGRVMTPVNIMVKQFDQEHDSINLDFVLFYDGNEFEKMSVRKDEAAFRDSWRRLGFYQSIPSDKLLMSED